jgi:hypothetical protein
MRDQLATCLFETSRRAEATVLSARLNLKEHNVGLSFYGDYQPAHAGQQTYYTRCYQYYLPLLKALKYILG